MQIEHYVRVLINGAAYQFSKLTVGVSDPSLYFHFRMGQTQRSRKLSYHPTGTVKHVNLAPAGKQYFEPLAAITKVNHILALTLDASEMTPAEDAGISSSPKLSLTGSWPAVGLAVAPSNTTDLDHFDRLEIPYPGFSVFVFDLGEIAQEWRRQGCYAFAPPALFIEQQMEEGPAELAYVQLAAGTTSPIVKAPNGKHYRTVYHSPMAREPDLVVNSFRGNIDADIAENREAHKFSFRLSTNSGVIKEENLDGVVDRIFLNARLRMPDRE